VTTIFEIKFKDKILFNVGDHIILTVANMSLKVYVFKIHYCYCSILFNIICLQVIFKSGSLFLK